MNLILATTLVVPDTVDSLPPVITAYVSGLLAPLGLWGILFVASVVKRGIRTGGGGIVSND